jgi:hypothetical protein
MLPADDEPKVANTREVSAIVLLSGGDVNYPAWFAQRPKSGQNGIQAADSVIS